MTATEPVTASRSAVDDWEPVRRIRTHERVLSQIAKRILDGRLGVGDRLPSERELVAALGVSRTSVREALRILESMGVIEANVGSGRDAGSTICGRPSEALSNLLKLHMALARFQLADLVEVRIQLERGAAARAAGTAQPSDIARLRELVEAMQDPNLEHSEFHDLDTELHVTIARISGNVLVADLMQAMRGAVRAQMESAFQSVADWDEMAGRLCREHTDIVSAIEGNRPREAADLVAEHIALFYEHASDVHLDWRVAT